MAEAVPGLIDIVGFIGDAVGKGQSIVSFFKDGQPTMEDIAKAFAAEVQQIFATQLAQEDVRTATAHLEAARQFFADDYQNAVNNNETDDQLVTLINGSNGPGLAKLRSDAILMDTWVGDPSLIPGGGGQAVINQAATLYLAIQTFRCAIYCELSRRVSDPKDKKTQLDDAKSAAQDALTTMKDVVMKILVDRCRSLSVGQWYHTKVTPPPDRTSRNYFGATLVDSWLHGDGGYTLNTTAETPHGPSDGENAQIQGLIAPYQFMLWYGGPTAEAALTDAIAAAGLPGDSTSTFTSSDLQSLRDFGAWAVKVRTSLLSLDRIARGAWIDLNQNVLGHAKHENWRWCSGCGVLYQFGPGYSSWQGTVQQICPVYGANHRSSGSSNYLVCSDATAAPNASQDGWAWCASCGVLHHDGAGDHCPFSTRGGPHMPRVVNSPTFHVMLGDNDTDIQSGWRWCNKCSALHWPLGPSVCPTGGKHSTDGSGLYRLEYLGGWSPTLNGGEEFDVPRE